MRIAPLLLILLNASQADAHRFHTLQPSQQITTTVRSLARRAIARPENAPKIRTLTGGHQVVEVGVIPSTVHLRPGVLLHVDAEGTFYRQRQDKVERLDLTTELDRHPQWEVALILRALGRMAGRSKDVGSLLESVRQQRHESFRALLGEAGLGRRFVRKRLIDRVIREGVKLAEKDAEVQMVRDSVAKTMRLKTATVLEITSAGRLAVTRMETSMYGRNPLDSRFVTAEEAATEFPEVDLAKALKTALESKRD